MRRELALLAVLSVLGASGGCTVATSSDVFVDQAGFEAEPYSSFVVEPGTGADPATHARDVTIVDGDVSLDLGTDGIPLKVSDIPGNRGYETVPVEGGKYYFFVGEIVENDDGSANWYANVPAQAQTQLRKTNSFHMVDANGNYTQKFVLWSHADESGDTTYLLYDPELGPACHEACEELAGTTGGRFIVIAPGD